ncbi:MAG TPA: HAMP domain-containing sensor histidine kinase [Gemmatimonadaceae bacterium]|nr:HAMP domain-containing sensor histidine kinase [Gemmatimonadaceae bacterium]
MRSHQHQHQHLAERPRSPESRGFSPPRTPTSTFVPATYRSPVGALPIADLLATIAHELRNPLTVVRGETAVIRRHRDDPNDVTEACAVIDRQVNQIAVFLRDLATFVAPPLELHDVWEVIDASDLLASALQALAKFADTRATTFTVEPVRDQVLVVGNTTALTSALTSILTTAVKFSGTHGTVAARVVADEHWVELRVRFDDNEMTHDQRGTAFEPFVRARRDGVDWAGVSMALARRTVEAHGGAAIMHGGDTSTVAEFSVCLPRYRG